MTHSVKTWEPHDGNPYGLPGRGNADELWQLLRTPCAKCGATSKRITIEGNKATVTCGNP